MDLVRLDYSPYKGPGTIGIKQPFLADLLTTALLAVRLFSVYIVVASRILQGLSTSIVYTTGLSLLVDTVDKEEIGVFMGYFSSSSNVSLLASPLVGGLVYSRAGYYAVFIMLFALIFFDILFRLGLVERKDARKWAERPENDFYGACAEIQEQGRKTDLPYKQLKNNNNTTESLVNPSREEQYLNLSEEDERTLIADNTIPTKSHPSTPSFIILLKSPRLSAAIYGIFINFALLAAFDGALPLFVKRTFGWGSLGAGLVFLCITLPTLIAPLVGLLSDKYGPRWFAVCGFVFTTPSLVLLRQITHDATEQVVLLCALLVLFGTSISEFSNLYLNNHQMRASTGIDLLCRVY